MESVCGLEQGSGGDHAVNASNGGAVRRAQPVSSAREHSRRSRVSCLAQTEVQRGPAVNYRGLLRRRENNIFAGIGVFLPRCPVLCQTGRATVSRATSAQGTEPTGAAEERVEVRHEKHIVLRLALAGVTDGNW